MDPLTGDQPTAEDTLSRQCHRDRPADTDVQRLSARISHEQQCHALMRTTTGPHGSCLGPIELNRINTYRLQHAATRGSRYSAVSREQWLPLGAGKPFPPSLPDTEEYVVEFTGPHDSLHPHNWPLVTKYVNDL